MISVFNIQKSKCWDDLNIPAKLFYHNLGSDDLRFLIISGKPKEKQLTESWDQLYDKFFEKKDNRKAKLVLKTKNKIALLTLKIGVIRNIVKILCIAPLDKENKTKVLRILRKHSINIDTNKDFTEEIHRVVTMQIPQWETNLELQKDSLEKLSKGEASTFERNIEIMSDAKGRNMDEDITLIRYLEAEKLLEEKAKRQRAEQNKGKRRR